MKKEKNELITMATLLKKDRKNRKEQQKHLKK